VLEALEAAAPGLREGNPQDPALIAAAQRAEAQLDSGVLGPEFQGHVEQLLRDLDMLARRETARLQAAGGSGAGFDFAGADQLYAQAFKSYGLDVTAVNPSEAAERIRTSAICTHLVAALDDWAFVRTKLHRRAATPLRAVADLADDDRWRQRLRGAAGRGERAALEGLAREAAASSQPPANLVLLARALRDAHSEAAAERLLRRAQAEHPADFWINFELGSVLVLKKPPDIREVVRFFQVALALRPQSLTVYNNLACALRDQGKPAEAEAACRKAIQLQPDDAFAHNNLGNALRDQGKPAEAEAACRKAIRLQPVNPNAYCNLGNALHDQGKLVEAVAAYRKAIQLQSEHAEAYNGLGSAFRKQGKLVEAEAAQRKAIGLKPDDAFAHNNLGNTLSDQGKSAEAEAAYRKAIGLKPALASAHRGLGKALSDQGKSAEAEAAYRKAIEFEPKDPKAHYNLGNALREQGKPVEAEVAYRKAIRLQPGHAEAHAGLGFTLQRLGRFPEALAALKRSHNLGSKRAGWPYPSAQWVREAEQFVALDAKLPKFLSGEAQPTDAGEGLNLARLCHRQKKLSAAARFYVGAFAAQPKLADDLNRQYRYSAACAAALAGCGQGKDAADLPQKERARLRRQALAWLRADLDAWNKLLKKGSAKACPVIVQKMRHWQADTDFAGVRGPDALARLPEAERPAWQKLWADVADLLDRAGSKAAAAKRSRSR
jgi:tetratricopeptide (TPR) repeat protein